MKNLRLLKYLFILLGSYFLISCASNSEVQPKKVLEINPHGVLSIMWDKSILSISYPGSFVPIVDNNAIFTADTKGNIFRLDNTDGTIIKKFNIGDTLLSGVGVSSDAIFVTNNKAYLLSISKVDGNLKWQAKLPSISIEAPQVVGDTVVVRTNDAQLLAFNINDGKLIWVYQKPSPPLTIRATNTFQVVGKEVVLAGQPGGRLVLINMITGSAIWENFIAIPKGATDLDKLTDIITKPILDNKQIFVATYNGKIVSLDATTNNIIWSKNFSSSQGLTIDEKNVYAVSQDSIVYCFDKTSGMLIWKNDELQYNNLSTPVIFGNYILTVDIEGFINLFARDNGKLISRAASALKGGISFPIIDGRGVVIQSANGHIAKILQ